ncbi:hypothetical protein CEUSTIGMA_g679.t1 [Chlamydomonas eustigma]|uniref:Uncharacterized protein n=1 Tax=Chlamydomonas eustigma TaxID=1157962 RepID=A0A250WRA3_9CHLO|nr:hypothetical protein CEUSTIGMA_g679.t1 [Chlamydomonas eustigma]|eukprot:GAX73226.1 hypothetical protein CEUSTIGMA_g679.t1 [Chlamydomonas eustigma]
MSVINAQHLRVTISKPIPMSKSAFTALSALLICATLSNSLKFLILPTPHGCSHLLLLLRLGSQLSAAGHEIAFCILESDKLGCLQLAHQEIPNCGPDRFSYIFYQDYNKSQSNIRFSVGSPTSHVIEAHEDNFQPCNPSMTKKLQNWWMSGAAAVLSDSGAFRDMHSFRPDAIVVDALFIGGAYLADILGAPKVMVVTAMVPPLEEVLLGMVEPASEVPCYQSGLPRDMGMVQVLKNWHASGSPLQFVAWIQALLVQPM